MFSLRTQINIQKVNYKVTEESQGVFVGNSIRNGNY